MSTPAHQRRTPPLDVPTIAMVAPAQTVRVPGRDTLRSFDVYYPDQLIVRVHERALSNPTAGNPLGLPPTVNALILAQKAANVIKGAEPLVDVGHRFFQLPVPVALEWRQLGGERALRDTSPAPIFPGPPPPAPSAAWRRQIRSEILIRTRAGADLRLLIAQFQALPAVVFAEKIPKRLLEDVDAAPILEPRPPKKQAPPGGPQPPADDDDINPLFLDGVWGQTFVNWRKDDPVTLGKPIAMVDSGIDTSHAVLQNSWVAPQYYYFTGRSPVDVTDHGTAVASILAGAPFSAIKTPPIKAYTGPDIQFTGGGLFVGAAIMSFNVITSPKGVAPAKKNLCGAGASAGEICPQLYFSALSVILNHAKPRVVNLSIFSLFENDDPGTVFKTEAAWFAALGGAGIVCVACAGNHFQPGDWTPVTYPARLPEVISVGAVRANKQRAAFSNYSIPWTERYDWPDHQAAADPGYSVSTPRKTLVDLLAPGNAIFAASAGGGTRFRAGTSFAAPFISGAAAWLLEQSPTLSPEDVRWKLTSAVNPGSLVPDPAAPALYMTGAGVFDFSKL